jgi:hypothetical protein
MNPAPPVSKIRSAIVVPSVVASRQWGRNEIQEPGGYGRIQPFEEHNVAAPQALPSQPVDDEDAAEMDRRQYRQPRSRPPAGPSAKFGKHVGVLKPKVDC